MFDSSLITYAVSLHFSQKVNDIVISTLQAIADKTGNRFMIENNGFVNEEGSTETNPVILCDNDELAPLFSKKLTGRIKNVDCPEKNRIIIEIYTE